MVRTAPKRAGAPASNKAGEPKSKKAKTESTLPYETFEKGAKPLNIIIKTGAEKDDDLLALPKQFNTKSYGFGGNAHITVPVEIDGKTEELQATVSVNIVVKGSKPKTSKEVDEDEEENEDEEKDEN